MQRVVVEREPPVLFLREDAWIDIGKLRELCTQIHGRLVRRDERPEERRAVGIDLRPLVALQLQEQNAAKLIELEFAARHLRVVGDDLIEQPFHRARQRLDGGRLEVRVDEALRVRVDGVAGARDVGDEAALRQQRAVVLAIDEDAGERGIGVVRPDSNFGVGFVAEVDVELLLSGLVVGLLALDNECQVARVARMANGVEDRDVHGVSLEPLSSFAEGCLARRDGNHPLAHRPATETNLIEAPSALLQERH